MVKLLALRFIAARKKIRDTSSQECYIKSARERYDDDGFEITHQQDHFQFHFHINSSAKLVVVCKYQGFFYIFNPNSSSSSSFSLTPPPLGALTN